MSYLTSLPICPKCCETHFVEESVYCARRMTPRLFCTRCRLEWTSTEARLVPQDVKPCQSNVPRNGFGEKHDMATFLAEKGCPECGSKNCKLTGGMLLVNIPNRFFHCPDCNHQGTIAYKKLPIQPKLSSDQTIAFTMLVREDGDWQSYLRRIGKQYVPGEVTFA